MGEFRNFFYFSLTRWRQAGRRYLLLLRPQMVHSVPFLLTFYFLQISFGSRVLTSRFTDSMTSMKTSFFLYLMPSDRQDTALVTVAGGRGAPTSNLWPCWVMYLRETRAERGFKTNLVCKPAEILKNTSSSRMDCGEVFNICREESSFNSKTHNSKRKVNKHRWNLCLSNVLVYIWF